MDKSKLKIKTDVPNKTIKLKDNREFDGIVDVSGFTWVLVDGVYLPLAKSKEKSVRVKVIKGGKI